MKRCELCDLQDATALGLCDDCGTSVGMTLLSAVDLVMDMLADARGALGRGEARMAAGYHLSAMKLAFSIGEAHRVPAMLADLQIKDAA